MFATWCCRVAGLGMSAAEMAANAQLTDYVVHDLNQTPTLPFRRPVRLMPALCTVSVQYLLHPVEVFAEVCRVLRPDGCFPWFPFPIAVFLPKPPVCG